jgi:hypothetical protein
MDLSSSPQWRQMLIILSGPVVSQFAGISGATFYQ